MSSATRPRRPIRRTLVATIATLPLVELPAWWDEEPDDLARYLRAATEQADLDARSKHLTEVRAAAVAAMHRDGRSFNEISKVIGLTRPAVQKLVEKGRRLGS